MHTSSESSSSSSNSHSPCSAPATPPFQRSSRQHQLFSPETPSPRRRRHDDNLNRQYQSRIRHTLPLNLRQSFSTLSRSSSSISSVISSLSDGSPAKLAQRPTLELIPSASSSRCVAVAVDSNPIQPLSMLTRRARQPSVRTQNGSSEGLEHCANSHISPTIVGKRHRHTRSVSVHWSHLDTWQTKSQSRLRYFLITFIAISTAIVALYTYCVVPSLETASSAAAIRISPLPNITTARIQRKAFRALHTNQISTLEEPYRNSVIIYRIIGNDLPPRHEKGQSLRNLRFMLEHEDDFSFLSSPTSSYPLRVEKYYVLNRLTDVSALDELLNLFEEFRVPTSRVLTIPFRWQEYEKQSLRWDGGVTETSNLWGLGGLQPDANTRADLTGRHSPSGKNKTPSVSTVKHDTMTRLRAIEYTMHDKNLYAINNNGGRNFALDHGRSLPHARWILPLDGNCFLTPSSLTAMLQGMSLEGEGPTAKHYLTIPMVRIVDNAAMLADNQPLYDPDEQIDPMRMDVPTPDAPEEPQIGFRWDSTESYQADMRYGRRSKLELLWRLGALPFDRGLHSKSLPWERHDHIYITKDLYASIVSHTGGTDGTLSNDTIDYASAGWVNRLFSGQRAMEDSTPASSDLRRISRTKGIIAYLEDLDERVIRRETFCSEPGGCGFDQRQFWNWDTRHLDALRNAYQEQVPSALERVNKFVRTSAELLSSTLENMRWRTSTDWDNADPEATARDAAQLALLAYLTSDDVASTASMGLVVARFLPDALDTPAKRRAQAPGTPTGYSFPSRDMVDDIRHTAEAVDFRYDPLTFDPSLLVDTARLLSVASMKSAIPSSIAEALPRLHLVLSHHRDFLLRSRDGAEQSRAPPSLALAARYDEHLACLAAYLDDVRLLSRIVTRHPLRFMDRRTGQLKELGSSLPDLSDAKHHLESMYRGISMSGYPLLGFRRPDSLIDVQFDL